MTTSAGRCPGPMTPTFGNFATITLVQNGQVVFEGRVRIT